MKVRYLLTFPQIRAISLLAHIDGIFLSEEVDNRRLIEYDITANQKFMLYSLLNQKGFVVKDEPQWPSQGDEYYYINDYSEILVSNWDTIGEEPSYVDSCRRDIGNVFKTVDEAKFERERLKVCNKLKSLSDDDQEWNADNEHYQIVYDAIGNTLDVQVLYYIKAANEYWFKSEESALAAITAIGEDKLKKYVFNVKE